MLLWRRREQRRIARLRENGRRIWAEFVEVRQDSRFSFNGRWPFVVLCEAFDPDTGGSYQFVSQGVWVNPAPFLHPGASIPVFVDPDNYANYTVDLEAALPMMRDGSAL